MAEAVTYAALRFAKSPPGQSRPPPGPAAPGPGPPQRPPAEASDGELTYENLSAARPRQQAPGALPRRIWSAAPLALLAAGLFLAATCIGLGVRYWQVSQQLQRASQRHAAESSALAHRIGGQDENLTWSSQQLSRAQAELADTWLALQQCLQAGNSTQRQLEEEQKQRKEAESSLTLLWQEKEKGIWDLEAATSCQQIGCCPDEWSLFRWKCLRVSSDRKNWADSRLDCQRQQAQLLILKPWRATAIWEAIRGMSLLQTREFWVGLSKSWNSAWEWRWVDGSSYEGNEFSFLSGNCVKLSQGALKQEDCSSKHNMQYICEKPATPSPQ